MLDENTWKFINTFAPWFSATGTIAAVIISLRFARRDKKIRLEVSAGHRLLVTIGAPGPHEDFLCIHIVNVGHRDAQVTGVGWKVGIFRKRYAVQTLANDEYSSQLPIRLKDGEEAKYYVPLNRQTNWLEDFADKMLRPFPVLQSRFVVVQAFTSIGTSSKLG